MDKRNELMKNLKLSWLGSPIIENDNNAIHLETRKATALLAYIVLSPEPSPRERLAALFWPEFDQSRARANFRRALSSINQSLGPGTLVSSRETIGVAPDAILWQDVSEFNSLLAAVKAHSHAGIAVCPECAQTLERAIQLYRGEFLEGEILQDCPKFNDWQCLQREVYRLDLASSLEKLTYTYSALGEWDKVIHRALQWVNIDPLHEEAHRILMNAYAQVGQRSAALRQFEVCSRWLQDKLGQSPDAETTAMIAKIQNGEIGKQDESKSVVLPHFSRSPNQPIIKTKLFVPRLSGNLISRPHLIERLEKGAECALTLISAPAGYGKTTLLAEWINTRQKEKSSCPWPVCWLSLDAGDNDPTRFLIYLMAALENVHPGVGADVLSLLQSSQSIQPQTPLSLLINNLQDLPQHVSLVLDDYQFIHNPTIHDGIVFLLEHMPDTVHVVIATRSDPPLPIARLRSQNQVNELRANELRFTADETAEFLNRIFHLSLTSEQISILENRTEGWIAGLQMAALSMQGRLDIPHFIEAFSGSHRFIMDYLTEEALNRQSTEIQQFLLKTSILERLSEPLCDFVLNSQSHKEMQDSFSIDDHSQPQHKSQNLLQELEISNLFIIPLDDDRIWYRYHHLFSELLRTRLELTFPELIPELHIRASTWFEKNEWMEESITHSLAARDWDNASRLIIQNIYPYLENGQMTTIMKWIEDFPQEVIFSYPKLCVLVAEMYAQAGKIDQIDPLLDRAEETVSHYINPVESAEANQELKLTRKDVTYIHSMAAILRGLKSVCSGDPNRALTFTQSALTDFPEMESRDLAVLFWVEGWASRSLGDPNQAIALLTKANEYAFESGANLRDISTDLAISTRLVGKLPQAIEILTHSLQVAAERGIQNQGNLSRDESFLSFIYFEQNQLDLAFTHANRAIAYTQWWPSHNIIATAYTSLAQILLAWDDPDGSLSAIQKADQERKNRLMTPFVHSLVEVTKAHIWLARGEWDQLDQWSIDLTTLLNSRSEAGEKINEYSEMQLTMLVRVWIAKTKIDKKIERYKDCYQLLVRLEHSSTAAGRINSLVEILFLKDCILFLQGRIQEAINDLDKCLSIAEPGGYMRIFLDSGEPGHALLGAYLQNSHPIHKSYALKIFDSFSGLTKNRNLPPGFPESITSRELEVLQLLADGYSNRQIAEKLVLAEGTVKFHVHNLLFKLQVESRTQAIAKVKNLF